MSNEILSGQKYDEKSDVYSFGIVFNEIVTRQLPFTEYKEFITTITEWVEYKCLSCGDEKCSNLDTCKRVKLTQKGLREEFKKQQIINAITHNHLRPKIVESANPFFRELITQLWHFQPKKRPSFKSVLAYLETVKRALTEGEEQEPWKFCLNTKHSFFSKKDFFKDSRLHEERRSFYTAKKISVRLTTKIAEQHF